MSVIVRGKVRSKLPSDLKIVQGTQSTGRKLNRKQKKQVYRIVNSKLETKWYDLTSNLEEQVGLVGKQLDITGIPIAAAGIFPGRVGEQINPIKLEMRFTFYAQSTNVNHICRVTVFQWRTDSGVTLPTLATIFDSNATLSATNYLWSPFNFENRHQYTVIKDKMFDLQGNVAASNNLKSFVFHIPLTKYAKVNYNAGATTGDHHIFILFQSSITQGANATLFTNFNRITYKDA